MLKQRIITALAMLALLLPAVFYPRVEAFAAVALVLIAAGAWEWARLNQVTGTPALVVALVCVLACSGAWLGGWLSHDLRLVWWGAAALWGVGGFGLLAAGVPAWARVPQRLRLVLGWLALCAAWLAVVQARMQGVNYLFSVLFLVWAADVFAYFAGRALGTRFIRRRLAPSISPGKSWEGALGGACGVLLIALLWQSLDAAVAVDSASLYSRLAQRSFGWMLLGLVVLTALSVMGDLVESLIKRSAGVKDSSALLPGHGGVLDRVDALLPVLPVAMLWGMP